jgi:hypothetical protein
VRELRPTYLPLDPAGRTAYERGEAAGGAGPLAARAGPVRGLVSAVGGLLGSTAMQRLKADRVRCPEELIEPSPGYLVCALVMVASTAIASSMAWGVMLP